MAQQLTKKQKKTVDVLTSTHGLVYRFQDGKPLLAIPFSFRIAEISKCVDNSYVRECWNMYTSPMVKFIEPFFELMKKKQLGNEEIMKVTSHMVAISHMLRTQRYVVCEEVDRFLSAFVACAREYVAWYETHGDVDVPCAVTFYKFISSFLFARRYRDL
jgi:hypothetical protein